MSIPALAPSRLAQHALTLTLAPHPIPHLTPTPHLNTDPNPYPQLPPLTRYILLAASLRQHGAPKLRVLSLGHSIGDSGGAALAAALRGGGAPLLREVCISSSHLLPSSHLVGDSGGVGDATCIELAAAVAALPELREISLGYGCVGDVGAAAPAAALASDAKPRHLEALWLGGNAIGDVGACALAKTLEPRAGGGKPLHMLSPQPEPWPE